MGVGKSFNDIAGGKGDDTPTIGVEQSVLFACIVILYLRVHCRASSKNYYLQNVLRRRLPSDTIS